MLTRQDLRRIASTLLICGDLSCGSAPPPPPPVVAVVEPSPSPARTEDPPEEDLSWAREDDGPPEEDDDGFEIRPSGLGIEQINPGHGPEVKNGDEIAVHYEGTLEDGTVFDSSRDRGMPLTFRIGDGHMIKGWEEGLIGMRPGGIRRLIIPPDLGYGAHGRGSIPPNAILEFRVKLVEFKPAAP